MKKLRQISSIVVVFTFLIFCQTEFVAGQNQKSAYPPVVKRTKPSKMKTRKGISRQNSKYPDLIKSSVKKKHRHRDVEMQDIPRVIRSSTKN